MAGTAADRDGQVDALLYALERQETRSLSWGHVDGLVGEDEMYRMAEGVLSGSSGFEDADDLLAALLDRRLAFEMVGPRGSTGFRSRFAEGVRLMARLKQLFPGLEWQGRPDLVADFRVDHRRRLYPARNVVPADALAAVSRANGGDAARTQLAAALVADRPLARFQVDAATLLLGRGTPRSVIVSAGTGSGKTLAFYLPALAEVGARIEQGRPWTKVLAIYPRRELLKDQLLEAYRNARLLDDPLARSGKPPIRIGAFFGPTPNDDTDGALDGAGWANAPSGRVCPFLNCPRCAGPLTWRHADRREGRERLRCDEAGCGQTVEGSELTLTRRSMIRAAPDMVFTTAESLNQRLSDVGRRHVFGLVADPRRRAFLVLLDEVHTYGGTSGAQAALLMRRWRHAHGGPVGFVGLSATLGNPREFFAELTGLREDEVDAVSPAPEDMEASGAEYQLVLRANPASGASLLSTSIQAGFLLPRLMDPVQEPSSQGRFGQRVFAFTDDLDVTNRLFNDVRSAEGYDHFGRRLPDRRPLADLRSRAGPDARRRSAAGQNWSVLDEIGHRLDTPLQVSRTSSQDQGTDVASQLVVATASLEVGFNDPRVGAVLQHKAPQGPAAFLQRRGRAGRSRAMRPWMTTVLSDFGRDRLAYQSYEQLFDPRVPAQTLPVQNEYVLRMQAVFAFLDWLSGLQDQRSPRVWIWHAVNGPPANSSVKAVQDRVVGFLSEIMKGTEGRIESLTGHLARALGINLPQVEAILWEPPRPLLLEVVPTLARRIVTGWRLVSPTHGGPETDLKADGGVHPLPDFLPTSLFTDLSLPEVQVAFPPATVRHDPKHEFVPVLQALRTLAPGRVTRRFAPERGGLSHWVPVPLDRDEDERPIDGFCPGAAFLGTMHVVVDGAAVVLACYRPWSMKAEAVPRSVRTSSNATLHWAGRIVVPDEGVRIRPPGQSPWAEVIEEMTFYLHSMRQPVTVRRFATGSTARVRIEGAQEPHVVETRYVDGEGRRAALGFDIDVDAVLVRYRPPADDRLSGASLPASLVGDWRSARYRDSVTGDDGLEGVGDLQRDALQQAYLCALLVDAERQGTSLEAASRRLSDSGVGNLVGLLDAVFGGDTSPDDDQEERSDVDASKLRPEDRAGRTVRALLGSAHNRGRLAGSAAALWAGRGDPGLTAWLRERMHEAFGQAFLTACWNVLPRRVGGDALVLDLSVGEEGAGTTVREFCVSESTVGGGGVLSAIAQATAADPRCLLRALEVTVAPGDLELASDDLERFAGLAVADDEVREAVRSVRNSTDHVSHDAARGRLFDVLELRGVPVTHAVAVALNARLLRPGTDAVTDRLVADLLVYWKDLEVRHGVSVDLRAFCVVAATHVDLGDRVAGLPGSEGRRDTREAVQTLAGLLWPRATELRRRALDSYSPFSPVPPGDPAMIREFLLGGEPHPEVDVAADGWLAAVGTALSTCGVCKLTAARGADAAMSAALTTILATPVDMDFLQLYPNVEKVGRLGDRISVTLVLREVT